MIRFKALFRGFTFFPLSTFASVPVAILDTGIDSTLPIFERRLTAEALRPGSHLSSCTDTGSLEDDQGHGTAVAGVIAELSPAAELIPIRFNGVKEDPTEAKMICAVDLAIRVGARVMNVSYGKSRSSPELEAAFRRASDAGILIVAAAGNEFVNRDKEPYYPANYAFPTLISVAASDSRGRLLSSFPENWDLGSAYGPKTIDVAAPGANVRIVRPGGREENKSGTSYSAAHVSAIAAEIWDRHPHWTAEQVKARILSFAVPVTRSLMVIGKGPYVRTGYVSIDQVE